MLNITLYMVFECFKLVSRQLVNYIRRPVLEARTFSRRTRSANAERVRNVRALARTRSPEIMKINQIIIK